MFKRLRYTIVLIMLFSIKQASAQIAMPDTVCIGTNRIYKVNDAATPSTYTWKIGGVTQPSTRNEISITWNTAGVFLLTVQEHLLNGCDGDIRSGLVIVNPLPVANAGPDITICSGKNGQLNGSGGAAYQWSPATYLSNTAIRNPLVISPPVGNLQYYLKVTDANGCASLSADTVNIKVTSFLQVFAGNDTSVGVNQPLQLNAIDINNSGFISYTWSPSFGLNNSVIKNPVAIFHSPNSNITYTVTARDPAGCEAKDDINIKVFIQPDIYVPNAFTPNGDGLNDIIRPILVGMKELRYFTLFNRYGQTVYTTTLQGAGWNGIFNSKIQNSGTYIWQVQAIDYRGNIINRSGSVILIR